MEIVILQNARSIEHTRETREKKPRGYFQVLENNLVVLPEEVGLEFSCGICGLRLASQILGKKI